MNSNSAGAKLIKELKLELCCSIISRNIVALLRFVVQWDPKARLCECHQTQNIDFRTLWPGERWAWTVDWGGLELSFSFKQPRIPLTVCLPASYVYFSECLMPVSWPASVGFGRQTALYPLTIVNCKWYFYSAAAAAATAAAAAMRRQLQLQLPPIKIRQIQTVRRKYWHALHGHFRQRLLLCVCVCVCVSVDKGAVTCVCVCVVESVCACCSLLAACLLALFEHPLLGHRLT